MVSKTGRGAREAERMIFYFSATGNTKYVAQKLAADTQEELISIIDCVNNGQYRFSIKPDESVGILSPTYYFGFPPTVEEFLAKAEFESETRPYVYFAATYGTTPGYTGSLARSTLAARGYAPDAAFSVKMPDSWTPGFDLSDPEKIRKINLAADSEIDVVVQRVCERTRGDFMKRKVPRFAYKIFYRDYAKSRMTNHFHVEDTCVGCGLCAKNCPVNAIEIQNGKPVWVADKCLACLGCLHRCPNFSIQYGENTKRHGQYLHPEFKNP